MKLIIFGVYFLLNISIAVCQEYTLKCLWEGEIDFPQRPPIVLSIDFGKRQSRFSTTGEASFPLKELKSKSGDIRFQLYLGREVVSVHAIEDTSGLRGIATFINMQGELLAQGEFLLQPIPELPPVYSREQAWLQDLDMLISRFLPYDKSFSKIARKEFRRHIRNLKDSLAYKNDAELMVELARAVALSGNAHTRLYLVRNRTEVRRLPIRLWCFPDGYYVVRATDSYKSLLGCRVEKINEMRIEEAAKKVSGIKPGNRSWQQYMSSYMLTSAEILYGCHIIDDVEKITLELQCSDKKTKRVIVPLPLHKSSTAVESWWDLSPFARKNVNTPLSVSALERIPLYLSKPDVYYWYEYLSQQRILYFQYNRSQEMMDGPSLKDFGDELLRAVNWSDVEALVVDLRFNTGGNANLATPLMKRLQEKMTGKKVFVITGRATFSAGISHVAQWKQWGAEIVGEHVGDELDFWAEGGNVNLPNSKLRAHYSNGFHSYSTLDYPERKPYVLDFDLDILVPDFPIEITWADYVQGRDPTMELIESVIIKYNNKNTRRR